MCASLALIYRHYLLQDGGLLSWVPGLVYKVLPVNYDNWKQYHKAIDKILITCPTCQACQIAFWIAFCNGSSAIDSLLCAAFSGIVAHWLNLKLFG